MHVLENFWLSFELFFTWSFIWHKIKHIFFFHERKSTEFKLHIKNKRTYFTAEVVV